MAEPLTLTEREQEAVERDCKALLLPYLDLLGTISANEERASNKAESSPGIEADVDVERDFDATTKRTAEAKAAILESSLRLRKTAHASYLRDAWENGVSQGFQSLDASRPWMCYWVAHALALLDELPVVRLQPDGPFSGGPESVSGAFIEELDESSSASNMDDSGILRRKNARQRAEIDAALIANMIDFLARCQGGCTRPAGGGFAGGPQQLPHLAPTYAAVNALVTLGTPEALAIIDRDRLYSFLRACKQPDGSFVMHEGGEVDIRGAYCAMSVARLCNILTPELESGVASWVARCQTHEGGFGGDIGNEAHGGYSYCAVACLCILGRADLIDVPSLTRWVIFRQMDVEGGFQGRANKLVDACYSWWQAGMFPILDALQDPLYADSQGASINKRAYSLYRSNDLQLFILACSQDPRGGGLRDKPGKSRDFYHTCYALAGLSAAQHGNYARYSKPDVLGASTNLLQPTNSFHNVCEDKVQHALAYFSRFPPPSL